MTSPGSSKKTKEKKEKKRVAKKEKRKRKRALKEEKKEKEKQKAEAKAKAQQERDARKASAANLALASKAQMKLSQVVVVLIAAVNHPMVEYAAPWAVAACKQDQQAVNRMLAAAQVVTKAKGGTFGFTLDQVKEAAEKAHANAELLVSQCDGAAKVRK